MHPLRNVQQFGEKNEKRMAVILTFPEISMPISSNTWLTTASCSSSSPDSSKIESNVSLTITKIDCSFSLTSYPIPKIRKLVKKKGKTGEKKEQNRIITKDAELTTCPARLWKPQKSTSLQVHSPKGQLETKQYGVQYYHQKNKVSEIKDLLEEHQCNSFSGDNSRTAPLTF